MRLFFFQRKIHSGMTLDFQFTKYFLNVSLIMTIKSEN